ncbi:hypothetical protein I79_002437 [Cricetulus griseus]|uniref:Uncharacterized protein n=1 Tax=Cricetulus griseus TaxID=10029 RepID=G3GXE7_CRIGR|nr:hypothetical protein I79_002437 [Cricetulus griseus]
MTKSIPENHPIFSLAVLGPVCHQPYPQQYKFKHVPTKEGLNISVPTQLSGLSAQ